MEAPENRLPNPHPPPPPPHQSRSSSYFQSYQKQAPPPVQKPQQKRAFSFHSDKSRHSVKVDLHETAAEKASNRLQSKADPTLAMNEQEPAAVQATVKSSLASLRAMQHRDSYGNPISEPDRSNPTRSRWERPLDTIRSFEAAIDGGYSRKSYMRSDSESIANWNRRSSYYANNNNPRYSNSSYYGYGGRPTSSFRPESQQFEPRPAGRDSYRDSYYDDQNYNQGGPGGPGGYGPGPSRHRASRMQSEPQLGGQYRDSQQGVYPLPHKDRSYETVTSAAVSGSSGDPAGYQTDPTSSDNSSIERHSPGKRPEPHTNDYGIGFSAPQYQTQAFTVGTNGNLPGPAAGNGIQRKRLAPNNFGPPPVPHKEMQANIQRRPLPQLQQQLPLQQMQQKQPEPDKRKSWFARRFSKAN